MASKTIEARAVISAADQTGNTFDKIAAKLKGVEKVAKSFEGIKAPRFAGDLVEEMHRLNLSENELQGVRKSYAAFDNQLKAMRPGFAHYMRAHEEYKGKVVDQWREIKAGTEEADRAQKSFFKNAGHFGRHAALHMVGGLGAGYLGAHALGDLAKSAAERNREGIREEMAGFTPDQQEEANRIADEISRKHPSLSRTENLEDLRKNTARLGSFDRAKEIAEVYAKARIYNELSGGTEHELEKVSLAAEGAGAANSAGQYRDFMQGFLKARAVNSDYTGEDFAKDYRAATAAKYGWNRQFRENDFFTLASHTPGLGVKMATLNSALVGGRMTKPSKAALSEEGLLDKNGHLIDEAGLQANFFDWTQAHMRPVLEKKGVHFGEDMTEDDKRLAAGVVTKMFSARNAADSILAALFDEPLVRKARNRKTVDLDKGDDLASKDAGMAWAGVKKQIGDFGTELFGTSAAISMMTQAASDFAKYTSWVRDTDKKLSDWWHGNKGPEAYGPAWGAGAQPFQYGPPADDFSSAPVSNMEQARRAFFGNPVIRTTAPELTPTMTYGTGVGAQPAQSPEGGANVQVSVAGDLSGEAKNTIEITVKPTAWFEAAMKRVDSVIEMVGQLRGNGPGSSGRSSLDASAPRLPSTGSSPFAGY